MGRKERKEKRERNGGQDETWRWEASKKLSGAKRGKEKR